MTNRKRTHLPADEDWVENETGLDKSGLQRRQPDRAGKPAVEPLDEDNPYQNSDEALPEDAEEASISRDPSREGGRFGQS
jgi:hypothetical protein